MPEADTTTTTPRKPRSRRRKVVVPDPIYRYVKGSGWVPTMPRKDWRLTLEDCKEWYEIQYVWGTKVAPIICRDWEVIKGVTYHNLRRFDVIPNGNHIKQVISHFGTIRKRGFSISYTRDNGESYLNSNETIYPGYYSLILRPPVAE